LLSLLTKGPAVLWTLEDVWGYNGAMSPLLTGGPAVLWTLEDVRGYTGRCLFL
jgi:hypothetical protein